MLSFDAKDNIKQFSNINKKKQNLFYNIFFKYEIEFFFLLLLFYYIIIIIFFK